MSVLERISKCGVTPPRITIYGRPGVGKSTLASTFPKPLFLTTEDPKVMGIDVLEIKNYQDAIETIKSLLKSENLEYKTIVVDSLSKLDAMVVNHVITSDKAKTLASACGGYGARS